MKAIYFLELNGEKLFKCDTFWSMSRDPYRAKLHSDSKHDITRFFESLLYMLNDSLKNNPEKNFIGSIFGYQTYNDDQTTDVLIKNGEIPNNVVYLNIIDKLSPNSNEWTDFKSVNRDNKIKSIIK